MRTWIQKIIIWLFEKFAYDYWVNNQIKKEKERLMKEYNVKYEEVDDLIIELEQQERYNYCSGNSFF